MRKTYLDNAATTPMAPEVIEEMARVMRSCFGNPSSVHAFGREAKAEIERSRRTVAKLLNCAPGEIVFTSGGTEADNMALTCAVRDLGVRRIISSPIEHHAVTHTTEALGHSDSIEVILLPVLPNGHIDISNLSNLLADGVPTLVSLMHANNEIGNLTDIELVAKLCRQNGAWFHTDTVQTMAHYRMDLTAMGAHFVTCAAHKFHGPKGVGFLYLNSNVRVKPMVHGGAQERNMRGGTENIYGIVGLAKALELAYHDMERHQNHVSGLKYNMVEQLRHALPEVGFNGDIAPDRSLYTVLNVDLPPTPLAEMMLFNLDIMGVAASGGSACSSGSQKGSHVLAQLPRDHSRPAVRFSFSRYTTQDDVDFAVQCLKQLYAKVAAEV